MKVSLANIRRVGISKTQSDGRVQPNGIVETYSEFMICNCVHSMNIIVLIHTIIFNFNLFYFTHKYVAHQCVRRCGHACVCVRACVCVCVVNVDRVV